MAQNIEQKDSMSSEWSLVPSITEATSVVSAGEALPQELELPADYLEFRTHLPRLSNMLKEVEGSLHQFKHWKDREAIIKHLEFIEMWLDKIGDTACKLFGESWSHHGSFRRQAERDLPEELAALSALWGRWGKCDYYVSRTASKEEQEFWEWEEVRLEMFVGDVQECRFEEIGGKAGWSWPKQSRKPWAKRRGGVTDEMVIDMRNGTDKYQDEQPDLDPLDPGVKSG